MPRSRRAGRSASQPTVTTWGRTPGVHLDDDRRLDRPGRHRRPGSVTAPYGVGRLTAWPGGSGSSFAAARRRRSPGRAGRWSGSSTGTFAWLVMPTSTRWSTSSRRSWTSSADSSGADLGGGSGRGRCRRNPSRAVRARTRSTTRPAQVAARPPRTTTRVDRLTRRRRRAGSRAGKLVRGTQRPATSGASGSHTTARAVATAIRVAEQVDRAAARRRRARRPAARGRCPGRAGRCRRRAPAGRAPRRPACRRAEPCSTGTSASWVRPADGPLDEGPARRAARRRGTARRRG